SDLPYAQPPCILMVAAPGDDFCTKNLYALLSADPLQPQRQFAQALPVQGKHGVRYGGGNRANSCFSHAADRMIGTLNKVYRDAGRVRQGDEGILVKVAR